MKIAEKNKLEIICSDSEKRINICKLSDMKKKKEIEHDGISVAMLILKKTINSPIIGGA